MAGCRKTGTYRYFRFSAGCGPTSVAAGSSVVAGCCSTMSPADRKHQLALISHSSLSFSRLEGSACAFLQPAVSHSLNIVTPSSLNATLVHSLTEKTRGSTFADDLLELAARQHAPSYELLRETRHYYIRRVG